MRMGAPPALIYCADGNPTFARLAVECGWLYGARLPATVYRPVYFADQDWKSPDLRSYAAAVATHKPKVATVLDWEHDDQLPEVLAWAEEIAPYVEQVVVIPKVPGRVDEVPESVGNRPVVLGYSVPTSYGGTTCGVWEFGARPVHLLGGSPQSQWKLARFMNVVSLDGNMSGQQARRGRYWSRTKSDKGHWQQLSASGDTRERPAEECFRRSLVAIRQMWGHP